MDTPYDNCSQNLQYPFCVDGAGMCAECGDDSDCPDTTANTFCYDDNAWGLECENLCYNFENITISCTPGTCNNVTIDNCTDDVAMEAYQCSGDDLRQLVYEEECQIIGNATCALESVPDYETIQSCSLPNETCAANCSRCYDTTTPWNDGIKPMSALTEYNIQFELRAIPETGVGVVNYNFTNITFFEYQTTGFATWLLDDETFPANDITTFGVLKTWSRSHSNGRFIYYAILRNESGKTWHLPNKDMIFYGEEYCYGNLTYTAGTGTG